MSAPPSFSSIDLSSAESSLQSVAVHSSVDLIASLGSELPVHVYSGDGAQRVKRQTPGYLLDPAGDGHGLPDWAYQLLMSWLLRGNGYGDILATAPSGYPTQVKLFHPDDIGGWIDKDGNPVWTVNGKRIDSARFWHRRVNPVADRIQGLSPIGMHAAQIGLSLTTTRYGLQWFADGAHPGGMLTNELTDLKPEQAKTAKDRFMAAVRGNREPVVLGRGWKYESIQVAPEESQFLETAGYTEAQCCRIFGPGLAEILGYESGGSLTYSTVEGRSAHLLVYSLNKWLRRLERVLTDMLPRPQYARIDRDALLQATTLDRWKVYQLQLSTKARAINEVRDDEDWPAVPWGAGPAPADPPEPEDKPDDEPDEGEGN
ncbi:portal protein [Actinoplanes lobatus]|nr:portal protein [Actinoplanes lobatus]